VAIKSKYRSDAAAREEGVWVPLPGSEDESRIRIRTEDYAPYRKAISKSIQRQQGNAGPYTRRHQQDQILDVVEFDEQRAVAIAKHLLVDWDIKPTTMSEEDGTSVKFTPETAMKLLTDPDLYDFYLAIVEAVTQLTKAKGDFEVDRKKSSASDSVST
jgi:hypothetical protein